MGTHPAERPLSAPLLGQRRPPDPVRSAQAGRRTLTVTVSLVIWLAAFAGVVSADPPGNNGTIKVDSQPFDTHPNNEPHVGCIFQIDFYGFDQGANFNADVTFEAHPPTGSGVLLTDTVFIGEDDSSGGGSTAGLDAQRTYDLSAALRSFTPHPQQGFHVKLTVRADGSQGAATKHKVFWVTGCSTTTNPPPPPPPLPPPPPPPPPGGGTTGGTGGSGGGPTPTRGGVLTGTGGPGQSVVPPSDLPNTSVTASDVPIELVGLALVVAAMSIGASSFATSRRRDRAR